MAKRKLQLESSKTSSALKSPSTDGPDTEPSDKRRKVVACDFQPVDPALLPGDARLDLADAEIYYVEDFLCDSKTAKRWYDDLVELDTCKPIQSYHSFASAQYSF